MSRGDRWGTTKSEEALSFACDDCLPEASEDWYRDIMIEAPVSTAFRS